jgi:probable rRNA maturation factor
VPVSLNVEHGPYPGVSRAEVLRRVKAMMTLLQLKKEEISITLTNDEQIHFLNRTYRAKDKPTDVLAFAMREGEFAALAGAMLGDVVVSVETARRQAERAKHDILAEVTMLLAHGLLHLLGWDHETAAKDRAMRAETNRLCAFVSAGASEALAAKSLKGSAAAKAAPKTVAQHPKTTAQRAQAGRKQ